VKDLRKIIIAMSRDELAREVEASRDLLEACVIAQALLRVYGASNIVVDNAIAKARGTAVAE
jgi:hypothetical protein